MNFLNLSEKEAKEDEVLDSGAIASLVYHNIFDYPLNLSELIKWTCLAPNQVRLAQAAIQSKNGYFFLAGREGLIYKRILRKRTSSKKIEIAKKAVAVLKIIPTIKFVGITGALAMENATEEADIDLIIITLRGTLWTTRLATLVLLDLLGIPRRRFADKNQKDKLCFNIWLDEGDLSWRKKERNIYTAHEIAQIAPLLNKNKTYEKFIWENRWIREYWPNAAKILSAKDIKIQSERKNKMHPVSRYLTARASPQAMQAGLSILVSFLFEPIAFRFQYAYMKKKITREVVTPTRALFHPLDWSEIVLTRFFA